MADQTPPDETNASQDTEIEADVFDEETSEQESTDASEDTNESESEQSEDTTTSEDEGDADDAATKPDEDEASNTEPSQEDVKSHNAEMAQRRIAEKQSRQAREAQVSQALQQHVANAETDADRLVRTIEADRYTQQVKSNESQILTEFERVKADPALQMFNPENKDEFSPELYEEFQDSFEKSHVNVDQFGNIIGVNTSLYDKAKKWGAIWGKNAKVNQARGQKNARKNMARAEAPSTSTGKPPQKVDPSSPDHLWDMDD